MGPARDAAQPGHWATIAAIDFTAVEGWGRHGLVTMVVLFAIDLRSRRIHFAGITSSQDEAWVRQIGRNLTDPVDGFFREKRFCLMDRATKFTAAFRGLLSNAGTEPVRLPARSPNMNAWIERFMRSIKSECLDRMIFFGEASLRRAVTEYLGHYHTERNHQGLDNAIIEPEAIGKRSGPIRCRGRLGGMLRYYHRDAAQQLLCLRPSCAASHVRTPFSVHNRPRPRLAHGPNSTTSTGITPESRFADFRSCHR